MTGETLRREVRFGKGHAIRKTRGDGQDYGIAAMEIRFLLHGEHGSTQFLLYTGWYPEMVPVPGYRHSEWRHAAPSAWDLGYHWDVPQYADQGSMPECDCRPSGICFYDGSSLRADGVLERFFLEGEGAVWEVLEAEYTARVLSEPAVTILVAEQAPRKAVLS